MTRCNTYADALQSYETQGTVTLRHWRHRGVLHREDTGTIVLIYRHQTLLECHPSGHMTLQTPVGNGLAYRRCRRVVAEACAWYLGGGWTTAVNLFCRLRTHTGDVVVRPSHTTLDVWPSDDGQTLRANPTNLNPFVIVVPDRARIRAAQRQAGLPQWRVWLAAYRQLSSAPLPRAFRGVRGVAWHLHAPTGTQPLITSYVTGGDAAKTLPERLADRTQWPALAHQYSNALVTLVTDELCRRDPRCLPAERSLTIPLERWEAVRRRAHRVFEQYGWL